MWDFIVKYWLQVLFGLVVSGFGLGFKRISSQMAKQKSEAQRQAEESACVKEACIALLHNQLYEQAAVYLRKGCIDTDGLENIDYTYNIYHKLGGNGTGTNLYNRAKELPLKQKEEQK